MSAKFFIGQELIEIRPEQLEELKRAAAAAPLKRARLCLHQGHSDPIQEMVIATGRESYVRPHRHQNKTVSYHIIEGELQLIFFDDQGSVSRRLHMGSRETGQVFIFRLSSSPWYSLVPLSDFVIIHETITGPFTNTEFAPWAPDGSEPNAVRDFLARLGF